MLPGQAEFSDEPAWNRASGPNKWNNQQGLYIYRADRLIQWGGWNRLRTNDEHTKMARVALDFWPDLDAAFGINISKAIVRLPAELRDEIQPAIKKVCTAADSRYRRGSRRAGGPQSTPPKRPVAPRCLPMVERNTDCRPCRHHQNGCRPGQAPHPIRTFIQERH